ncbi:MAG: hypothetical protein QM598_14120, partial [Protaetiibacter sp.]
MERERSVVPLTTRGAGRALAAALLAVTLAGASALGASAASATLAGGVGVRPASAAVTPGTGPVSVAVVVPITAPAT